MRPLSRAPPRGSARSSRTPRRRARRARAAPWPRPVPSAPGTGGRAPTWWSCWDQSVVARERSQLDVDLAAPSDPQPAQGPLVLGSHDCEVAGEAAAVAGDELTRVERDGGELALSSA